MLDMDAQYSVMVYVEEKNINNRIKYTKCRTKMSISRNISFAGRKSEIHQNTPTPDMMAPSL